jgi:hypothetical protein
VDITGLRVAIDASGARQGEQIFNQSLDSMSGRARTVSAQLSEGFRPGEIGLRSLGGTARTVSTQIAESFERIRTGMRGLVDSVLNFRTLFDAAILGVSFNSIVGQISKLEDIKRSLVTVTGSAAQAGATWRMLEADGEKFGLSVEDMAQKFARLSAATKGTALEGERTITIFRASEVAARAFGGGAEQADRTLQSFTNILSQANVQGDMMVRQLARFGGIPGAMEIAARAFFPLAKNSADAINAMQAKLKSGTLSSEEFVAKFTQQMVKEFAPAAQQAADSISAWQARVSNAFDALLQDMGEGGLGSSAVKFLKQLREEISSPAFKEAASQLGGLLTNALRMLGNAIEFAGQHVGLLKAAFVGIVAVEVIDFFASFTRNVLLLADAFGMAATKAIAFATARTAATAASEVGAIGAVGAMFAQGGVMTGAGPVEAFANGGVMTSSYGPSTVSGSQSRVPEGRISTVRPSILEQGYVAKPNVAFADGGVLTSEGPRLLRRYAEGGVATSPHVALFGEGSKPEAFVPLQDGQSIPVSIGASSAFVPLPDGRKIPATISVKRYAEGGVTTNDDSLASSALGQLQRTVERHDEAIGILERNAGVMPASGIVPNYRAERVIGAPQGVTQSSSALATSLDMAKQAAPPPTTPTSAFWAQPAGSRNQAFSAPMSSVPITAASASPRSTTHGSLMAALSAIAPAIMGAVAAVTTIRSAYRSEPQDNLLHRVAPPIIETRAVPGIAESAKKAAAGFDALANAAKPAERSLLSFAERGRALPPIGQGITKLMSSGHGGLAYAARSAQLAGAARPLANVGEQMGLFAAQEPLDELGTISVTAEKSVPKVLGLFEAIGIGVKSRIHDIGELWSSMWGTVVSKSSLAKDAVVAAWQGVVGTIKSLGQGLGNLMSTEVDSSLGRKISVGLANMAGLNKGVVGAAGAVESAGVGGVETAAATAGAGALAGELTGATGAAGGLSSALGLLANPIGLAVAAVAALGIGLYMVRDRQTTINGEAFRMSDIYQGVWMKIKHWAEAFWNWLSLTASKVFKAIGSLGEQAIDGVFGKGTTSKIEGWLGHAWEGFKGLFYNVAKQAKEAREQVEALAKAADIREKVYGTERFTVHSRDELQGALQPSVIDQIMQLEAQYPRGVAGKTPKEAATVQIPYGMQGGTLPLPITPDELKQAATIRDQVNNLLMGIGTGAPERQFRQPVAPWAQAINELQAKAALAGPTGVAAAYGADEVERLKEVAEAEKMIADWRTKGMGEDVFNRIRRYYDLIADGNNTLKANTEIEKERARVLATPTMGRTPTFEYVDRSTFGGVNPERDLGEAIARADIGLQNQPAQFEKYTKAVNDATNSYMRFMSAHVTTVQLKPLGFDDVTQAIQHGTFAYEEYLHLEQQQVQNWERLKTMGAETVAQWNREAEANYVRTAALKEYVALVGETEKAEFQIPRMRQLQTAQLQGGEATRAVQAQQAQDEQLFQITGARNWNEFKQQYGAALSTPEKLPTAVQAYAQNIGLIGGKPQQPKMLGVDIGTEQNPIFVAVSRGEVMKKVGTPITDGRHADFLSDILGPQLSDIIRIGEPQLKVPFRLPESVAAPASTLPTQNNMNAIDEAAARDLQARMNLSQQQNIDKTVQEIAALDPSQALRQYEQKIRDINDAVAQQPELWSTAQQAVQDAGRAYQEQLDKMLESTHNFVDGAKGAFDEWATHAMDAGAHAKEIATGFMDVLQKGITDELASGKNNFGKLFADLKKQIIGDEVQQFFTGPIAQGLGAVIPSLKPKEQPQDAMLKRLQQMGEPGHPLHVVMDGGGRVGGATGGAGGSGGTETFGETVAGSVHGAGGGGGLFSSGGGWGQQVGSAGTSIAGSVPTTGRGWMNTLLGRGSSSPITSLFNWALGPHGAPGPPPISMLPQLEGPSGTPSITAPQPLPMTTPALDTTNVWAPLGGSPPGMATGGPVRAGQTYMVGERGRELFVPKQDGSIVSNDNLKMIGFSQGGTTAEGGERLLRTEFGMAGAGPVLAFAQGGTTVGPIGVGGGGTVISPGGSLGDLIGGGTAINPSGLDMTVGGSGMDPGSAGVTYLNDPVTKKVRYALFNWQQTAQGGYSTLAGMMKQTGSPYQRNWWLTDFLPTMFLLFSNFVNAERGIQAGGGGSTGQMFSEALKGVLGIQQQSQVAAGNVGSVGGVSDPALGTPQYMPGGGPTVAAPGISTMNLPTSMPNLGTFTPQMPTLDPSTAATGGFMSTLPDNFLMPRFGPAQDQFNNYANGGIMTPFGNLPLRMYDDGGIATRPMAAIFGEGSMHEAYVPLPDGRTIPVSLQTREGSSGGTREGAVYRTEVHVHGVQDVDGFRRSRGQIMAEVSNAQAMHRRSNR